MVDVWRCVYNVFVFPPKMKQLSNLVSQFSMHVSELNNVQKEMDKIMQQQQQRST